MADEDRKKQLKEIARTADAVAAQHTGCALGPIATAIATEARRRAGGTSAGPAQVASDSYRQNYDILFGKRQTAGQA